MPQIRCDTCGESTKDGRLQGKDFSFYRAREDDLWEKCICVDCLDWAPWSREAWLNQGIHPMNREEAAFAFWKFDPVSHFYLCCNKTNARSPEALVNYERDADGIRIVYTCPDCLHTYREYLHSESIDTTGGTFIYEFDPLDDDY